jgi:SET domain-containing protein
VGYLFEVANKDILDGTDSTSQARFLNHSCQVGFFCSFTCFYFNLIIISLQPNLLAQRTEAGNDVDFIVLHDVKFGEELTFDYTGCMKSCKSSKSSKSGKKINNMQCNCKAQGCIGIV